MSHLTYFYKGNEIRPSLADRLVAQGKYVEVRVCGDDRYLEESIRGYCRLFDKPTYAQ